MTTWSSMAHSLPARGPLDSPGSGRRASQPVCQVRAESICRSGDAGAMPKHDRVHHELDGDGREQEAHDPGDEVDRALADEAAARRGEPKARQDHQQRDGRATGDGQADRKSTRLNSSHGYISYAV